MRLQGLVQIKAGQRLHIKACQPHGTDENYTEGIVRILVFLVQFPFFHLLPVWFDVQIPLPESLNLVLFLADNHTHLGFFHPGQFPRKLLLLLVRWRVKNSLLKGGNLLLPLILHIVVHADTGYLVEADEHRFATCPQIAVMLYEVMRNSFQTRLSSQEMHFLFKLMHYFFCLIGVEVCRFNGIQYLVRNLRILDFLYLLAAILIVKRNGTIFCSFLVEHNFFHLLHAKYE